MLAVIAIVAASGCDALSPGDLDVRAGCETVGLVHSMSGSLVMLDVRATGCDAPSDQDVVNHVARTVWLSIEQPVDALRVTVSGSSRSATTGFDRSELDKRFGPGPDGVVWPIDERGPGDLIWLLLPAGYAAVALFALLIVRRLRCAGAVVTFLRC